MDLFNFIDPETEEKFFFTRHSLTFRDGKWINVEKPSMKQIVNPANGNVLVHIEHEGVPALLKGNNKESLKKMLEKRSHEHFKKEIEEVKHEKNKLLNNNQ